MPGSYGIGQRGGERFLVVTAPRIRYIGFNELFRVSQRVPIEPGTTYTAYVVARAPEKTDLHIEVCEKLLLYPGDCRATPGILDRACSIVRWPSCVVFASSKRSCKVARRRFVGLAAGVTCSVPRPTVVADGLGGDDPNGPVVPVSGVCAWAAAAISRNAAAMKRITKTPLANQAAMARITAAASSTCSADTSRWVQARARCGPMTEIKTPSLAARRASSVASIPEAVVSI